MRRALLLVLLCLASASAADAQLKLPFFRKKKSQPPPAEAAAKAPAEAPAPGAAAGAPTPAAAAAPGTAASAGAAPAYSPSAAPQGPAGMTAEQQAGLQRMVDSAIAFDARTAGDTSRATLQNRLAMWQQVQWALPAGDPRQQLAKDAYDRALKAGDDARAKALAAGTADSVTKAWVASKIQQCRQALQANQGAEAEVACRAAQDRDPANREVAGLLAEALQAKRVADLRRKATMYGVILVPLLALLGLAVRAGLKKREENVKKAEDAAAKRSAVLQVVDGVGRGRLVTLDREKTIFKIGATAGAGDDNNDFVISDSAKQVSRFHCTLVRRDGAYFLVDASTNGTVVNGEAIKRGEHYPLEDGDEITIAEVSRLKFLHT